MIAERKFLTQAIHLTKHLKMAPLGGAGLIGTEFIKNLITNKAFLADKGLAIFVLAMTLVVISLILVYVEGYLLAEKEEINELLSQWNNRS